ncbi:MAG: AraC family transcriptional regulator [Spirochaetaceae bacterium]|jgi:AraC-like DNA-binding protein|nr:AraC family transcriptional regulator [Spirochaetaceae bacterium]
MVKMTRDEQFIALEKAARTMHDVHIINETADSITIRFKNDEGIGTVRRYALFPGIFLDFNDIETSSFPRLKGEIIQGFKINFCVDGRCEVKTSDGIYIFLEAEDISFSNLAVSGDFSFPYGRYHGIELHIYDSAFKQAPVPLFDIFSINLMDICKKYCPASKSFIARTGEEMKSVFLSMSAIIPECKSDYLRLKVIELLFLLMHIEKPDEKERRYFFTLGQIKIAKQVMNIISADLSKHYSVEKLAEQFSISPSSLNKYFYGVFGESIPSFLRGRRMNKAAEYLEKGKHQILDIALMMGYENASKFAAVFKAAKGESPLEYRRRHINST